jgi:hypothetical protein
MLAFCLRLVICLQVSVRFCPNSTTNRMKKLLIISALSALPAVLGASTIWQTSFNLPDYTIGELHGQNNWSYTPSATRLQSSFVTVSDSSTIGSLNINQRHVFVDANRSTANNARRMDQTASIPIPVSLSNPITYFSFRVAMGNSGTADNSEIFFAVSDGGLFNGTFIALKTSAVPTGSGINALEVFGAGTPTAVFNPAPSVVQETFYWVTLGTTVVGGLITQVDGWLNATLVDGVPVGVSDISLPLVSPIAVSSTLQFRAQNQPTAITDIVIAIPEPSTYAVFAGLLAVGAALVMRRRKIR